MDYFKANLAALAKRQPELAAALESADRSHIKTFPSADGAPAATVERTDATVAVHSRYNPLREARQALKQQSVAGSDYFIILGFGLGYLLDVVIEQTEQAEQTVQADCHYFVVEEDLGMLRAAFEVRDLTSLLAAHDVYFAWPTSGPELAEQWRRRFDVALARKSTYVIHPPSAALHPDFYKFAAETLQGAIYQITADITTLATKSQVYLDNFILNYPKAVAAPGINTFAGRFPNTPAVIVSAGPSLDKNIHELKGREDHILVVATDTSLKPLLAAGVEPHFVMTGDPSHANYLHLAGATTKDALLVMEATTHPQSADLFPGRVLSCTYEKSILTTLSGLLGDKGVLDVWGSVATMALDFALLLGCDPVIFIGQDLAYTGGRLYCSGVYFEKEWFKDVTTPEQREARLAALRAGNHPQLFDDIHGEPVETTKALIAYRNWILKVVGAHPETRFINATEGGILRGGVELLGFAETLERDCSRDLGLRSRVLDIYSTARRDAAPDIAGNLAPFLRELCAVQGDVRRGLDACAKPLQIKTGKNGKKDKKDDILRFADRLDKIKLSIQGNKRLAPLIDTFNQSGNVTFRRRIHTLAQHQSEGDILDAVQKTYSDYFASVATAAEKIATALSRL